MTTETNTMTEVTDDLNAFTADFFGNSEAKPEETPTEVPVAEESEEQTQTSDTAEEADEPESDEETAEEDRPKPKKRTTADRIKKLALDRAKQAEEIAALKAQIEILAGIKKEPLTQVKETATDTGQLVRPDPEKYQYGTLDDKYLEDLADYKAAIKLQEFEAKLAESQKQKAEQEAAQRASATLQTKAAEIEQVGTAEFDDFQEIVVEGGRNGDYALTQEMFETVAELPKAVAAKVLYHLATNPEESAQVAQMSPRQQALWFGRMEAKLATPSTPAPRKATAAPPPPTASTRGAGSKAGANLYDLDDPRALDAMKRALFG